MLWVQLSPNLNPNQMYRHQNVNYGASLEDILKNGVPITSAV